MEFAPTGNQQEAKIEEVATYEPQTLSLENKEDFEPWRYSFDNEYIPEQSDVVEKVKYKDHEFMVNRYFLVSEVAGLDYFFKLSGEESKHPFSLTFTTKAYEFAITNLDSDGTKALFEKMADFLETTFRDSRERIVSITISPANFSYSANDIEECISEITRNTKEYSEEVLRESYKGHRVFDLYRELFDKNFGEAHYNSISRAGARSRYFKIQFKKYLKNWEIDEESKKYTTFFLKRKHKQEDKPSFDEE